MKTHKKFGRRATSLILIAALLLIQLPVTLGMVSAEAAIPVIDIDATTQRAEISPYTLGSNHRHAYGGFGMFDTENMEVYPEFLEKTKEANLGVVRYPGGTIANLFTWKDTVGPVEERSNIVLGNSYASVFPYYGLDEHMKYTEDIGAEVIYMVGEAAETPEGAADLVEYLNGIPGENANGGTDWAQKRADNGHPEPYDVIYFEIGNEMYIDNQQYWLDYPSVNGDTDRARRYMQGDTVEVKNSPARIYGTWKDNVSDGSASQSFYTQYNPVVEGTDTVYVDGVKWTRVNDLSTSGSADRVYTFEPTVGRITYGDGVHGAIPAEGAKITVDYHHKHAGFTEYYDAMKAVDPDIKIFANLPHAFNFVEGTKCDGIVFHNYYGYSGYADKLTSAEDLHDVYMRMADQLSGAIDSNYTALRERSKRQDTIAAVTEFGSIDNPVVYSESGVDYDRDEARSLSRALSFAASFAGSAKKESLIHIQQAFTAYSFGGGEKLPNADYVYNSMYAPYSDDPTRFVEGGTALAYKIIGNNIGDTYRNSYVQNNPVVGDYASYDALVTTVTQDDATGDLYLMVVNRDADNNITATVNLKGYTIGGTARIQTLNGAEITSCNTPEHPCDITVTETNAMMGKGKSSFTYTFPAHSFVAIKLAGESADPYAETVSEDFEGELSNIITMSGNTEVQTVGENKALLLKRTGANASVTAGLTDDGVALDGMTRVKFKVRAEQNNNARLQISLKTGGTDALMFALEGGFVKNNSAVRAVYTPGQFHEFEIAVNHKAGQYVLYFDGGYIGSTGNYTPGADGLGSVVFTAMTQNGSFYIDDYSVETADTDIIREITQIDEVRLTATVGEMPELPETVTARYNTGESEVLPVTWEAMTSDDFSAAGVVEISGKAVGVDISARAVVTVIKAIREIVSDKVSALAGRAPKLPETVTVFYTDGTSEKVPVVWDRLTPEDYAEAGTLTVEGMIESLGVRAQVQVSILPAADVPLVSVIAEASGSDSGPSGGTLLDAFAENNKAGISVVAEKGNDGNLCLYAVNPGTEDTAVGFSLKGFTVSGAAAIRTAAYTADMDLNLWSDSALAETDAEMGIGGSSFSYVIPAGKAVAVKLPGAFADNGFWGENFLVRHFDSLAPGVFPPYFKNNGGAAAIAKDPDNGGNQVFMMKRAGADVLVESTLSGQEYPLSAAKTYNGFMKVSYRIKPLQESGSFTMALTAGGDKAVTVSFADGSIRAGETAVGSYAANQWYTVQVVADHQAGEYALYVDDACLMYRGSYLTDTDKPLDYLCFDVSDTDGTFLMDNYHVHTAAKTLTSQITQIDPVRLTVDIGEAPVLPETVILRYNTGEALEAKVEWEPVDPEDYAQGGVFEVLGTVKETGIRAKAVVTVDSGETPEILKGDVDMNGRVNVSDIMTLKSLIMNNSWTEEQLESGDLNGDGTLTVGDMLSIKNIIMSM